MEYEEALAAMRELETNVDFEVAHAKADDILCAFLRTLQYDDLVDAFEKIDKWYA